MEGKGFLYGLGIFLGILAVIFLVIFFMAWILIGLVFIVCISLIILIVILAIVAIVFLFAIPYYAVTKKPEVQYGGGYKLKDVKDKEDEKAENDDYRKKYSLKDMKDDK